MFKEHKSHNNIIYTIILLKSVCLSVLANCRSQFLLDRLGRCLKLFVSTDSTSCHKFACQFGQDFCIRGKKPPKLSRIPSRPRVVYLNEAPTGHCLTSVEKGVLTPTWLGALTHRTATVVGVSVFASACMHVCVLVCVMCLQYTIIILTQDDNDLNHFPIFHRNCTHWWFPLNGYPASIPNSGNELSCFQWTLGHFISCFQWTLGHFISSRGKQLTPQSQCDQI